MKCAKSLKRNQSRMPSTVDTGSGTAFFRARANSRWGAIAPIRWTCSSTFGIERMNPSSDTVVPWRKGSELFSPGAGAILVFLGGAAADAAGADQDTLAEDRHG